MNISLPGAMKAFVESQMSREGYASASEYLRALIRDEPSALGLKLLEGLQGPTTLMDREDWDSIEREAIGGRAGEQIRP